jgi:hypothetical protein
MATKKPAPPAHQQLPVPVEMIERRIYLIRGHKVMLDQHLAELYEVEPRALVQAVRRNIDRFPGDFMFQLNEGEAETMRSQFVIASKRNVRYRPYAFTEHGILMLSSVLRSDRAVQVNIAIMRAFVRLREALQSNEELRAKLAAIERKLVVHDAQFKIVFDEIRKMIAAPEKPRRQIGFRTNAPNKKK